MSPSIWTRCAASFRPRRIELVAFRVVESQHVLSTRKLVDSDEEQALLEELVDRVKPPAPAGAEFRGLHYLLFTPFRHPPLRYGSRFGTRAERGIWYGAKERTTCFAEVSYYRLLFLEGTSAELGTIMVELTAYTAAVKARVGADLTRPPFREHEGAISSKTSYASAQRLGAEMRAANIEGFLYVSARAPDKAINVGLFKAAFASKRPRKYEAWTCSADRSKVEFSRKSIARTKVARVAFSRSDFLVAGRLPSPAT
jgi:RES domain